MRDLGECWWLAVLELGLAADELAREEETRRSGEEGEICMR